MTVREREKEALYFYAARTLSRSLGIPHLWSRYCGAVDLVLIVGVGKRRLYTLKDIVCNDAHERGFMAELSGVHHDIAYLNTITSTSPLLVTSSASNHRHGTSIKMEAFHIFKRCIPVPIAGKKISTSPLISKNPCLHDEALSIRTSFKTPSAELTCTSPNVVYRSGVSSNDAYRTQTKFHDRAMYSKGSCVCLTTS